MAETNLGLVQHTGIGRAYVVEYDPAGQIVGASCAVELGMQDWTEEDLENWHMDDDVEWLRAADEAGDITHLPIPYIPGVTGEQD